MKMARVLGLGLLAFTLVLCLHPQGLRAAGLKAGVAAVDITPDVNATKVALGGYYARKGKPATGVHDPIMAKALVLSSGSEKVAIVTLDLCRVSPKMRAQVLERVRDLGFRDDNVLMTASHTHSGPEGFEKNIILGFVFGKYNEQLAEMTVAAIAEAIRQANDSLATASLRAGSRQVEDLTRNRRDPSYDYGTRRFGPSYNPDDPENVTDQTLTVLRVDGQEGKPLAVLVHFATHATVLGDDNFLVSADWPGVMQRSLEALYPGTVVMYMNGAQGDQAPHMPESMDDLACMEFIGNKLAEAALPLINEAQPVADEPLRSMMVRRRIPVSGKVGIVDFGINLTVPRSLMKRLFEPMPLMVVRVGDVVFMGCPLEMISDIGQTMKAGAAGLGVKVPIVAGLANDHMLYCATPEEYDEGGYEAGFTVFGKIEAGLVIGEQMMLVRQVME